MPGELVAPPSKPVTLEEVARVAGVSRATVSRVVNRVSTVDNELRETVQRAIDATGYRPNLAARSLVTRRAGSVALVLPDECRIFGDPFFGRVVEGAMGVVQPQGVHLVVTLAGSSTHQHLVADLRQGRLDGAILIHTHLSDPLPALLVASKLPVVLSGRPVDSKLRISHVDVDQAAGARLAADRLVQLGRRRVATIAGPLNSPAGLDRLEGFRAAMAAHGVVDVPFAEGDFSSESGARAVERLLAERRDLDGLFVASDLMAQGALPVLRRAGRRVPDDVAVVGFDDSSSALVCDPLLTTVRQPVEDMAAEMVRLLLDHVARPDRPVSSVVFSPTLVVRQSA
jgi:DNA-binding LacI/PurR family transcriptional regulator